MSRMGSDNIRDDIWVSSPDFRGNLPPGMATDGSVDMAAEMLEYGVDVDVEPPPSRTVIEESEVG
jgi:hypothetical protein